MIVKKRKFGLIIFIVFLLTTLFLNCSIDDESEAICLADFYVSLVFGNRYSDYNINAVLDDDTWVVYYYKSDQICGGGGPEIHISKSTGIIKKCFLQL